MKYRIKNWGEHQHYKDRNPPWVKLKVDILSSGDWVMWSDASRVLAIVCIALASKTGGEIDGSEDGLEYLKRAGYLNAKPNLKPLIESEFIIPIDDASKMLANASSSVSVSSLSVSEEEDRGVGKEEEVKQRPTLADVKAYCLERGNRVDPEKWLAYYESNGWRVGRNPMKDWKAAIRTWEKSEFNQPHLTNGGLLPRAKLDRPIQR